MRDSDWSRPNLLRSDWLLLIGAIMTTVRIAIKYFHPLCMPSAGNASAKQKRYYVKLNISSRKIQEKLKPYERNL